jgi:ATP-binding cassette subfamily B protein
VGALGRFYLDAFMGLMPIRAHGAQRAMRNEHESLLVEWARASLSLQRIVVAGEAVQLFAGFGFAAWLLFSHLQRGGEVSTVLLLIYWALKLPMLGQEIAVLARQYPMQRNVTLRLLEPLGASESDPYGAKPLECGQIAGAIRFENVSVRAAGHVILQDIDLEIPAGSHIGIVGPSGAGKSSLVGLLLGWHRAAVGRVLLDGDEVKGATLDRLRRETAWVDPTVQLWNRTVLDNLRYGVPPEANVAFGQVIEQADLLNVLKRMPDGLQTLLGEGGGLVSGGEGQRVRFARAMLRPDVRLVSLDEPFRGLDREQRRELLARARKFWRAATLLCITHDVSETQGFDRVLVIEGGKVIEDGNPGELRQKNSRYSGLMEAETNIHDKLWSNGVWRRLRLENGRLIELKREAFSLA